MDIIPTKQQIRPWWRWIFLVPLVAILIIPGWVFFSERGGLVFLSGMEMQKLARSIFPLFGLYAFTFVFIQVILGSLMPIWERLFPKIFIFHRAEGVFALLFSITHPILLSIGVGSETFLARTYVEPDQLKFIYLGYVALFLMILTVSTALLMSKKIFSSWWRKIHVFNYLVFFAAAIHSYNLGADVQTTGLRYLWIVYLTAVVMALIVRLIMKRRPLVAQSSHQDTPIVTPPVSNT